MLKEALHSSTGDFCVVVDAIHRVNECQVHEIQTALEIDRFKWPTNAHEVPLFEEIKHLVSKKCFELLYGHWRKVVEKTVASECVDRYWRICYGIPCVHDVQRFVDEGIQITPDDIHPFWMDLTWDESDNAILPYARSASYTASNEACDPDLHPPERGSIRSKGRPRGRRNPCRTNPLRSEQNLANFERAEARSGRHGRDRQSGHPSDAQYSGFSWGDNNVDPFMFRHIAAAVNTVGDGHCGYRALAQLMLRPGEARFANMKGLLCNHLEHNDHLYAGCYMGGYSVREFVDLQSYSGRVGGDRRYWIELPIMGLVFATVYQVPLVVLSWHMPFTCLPMYTEQSNGAPHEAILGMACIGNQDYFAAVSMISLQP